MSFLTWHRWKHTIIRPAHWSACSGTLRPFILSRPHLSCFQVRKLQLAASAFSAILFVLRLESRLFWRSCLQQDAASDEIRQTGRGGFVLAREVSPSLRFLPSFASSPHRQCRRAPERWCPLLREPVSFCPVLYASLFTIVSLTRLRASESHSETPRTCFPGDLSEPQRAKLTAMARHAAARDSRAFSYASSGASPETRKNDPASLIAQGSDCPCGNFRWARCWPVASSSFRERAT